MRSLSFLFFAPANLSLVVLTEKRVRLSGVLFLLLFSMPDISFSYSYLFFFFLPFFCFTARSIPVRVFGESQSSATFVFFVFFHARPLPARRSQSRSAGPFLPLRCLFPDDTGSDQPAHAFPSFSSNLKDFITYFVPGTISPLFRDGRQTSRTSRAARGRSRDVAFFLFGSLVFFQAALGLAMPDSPSFSSLPFTKSEGLR